MTHRPTVLALVASLGLVASAHAGDFFDHLTCFKVKDTAGKAVYTVNLTSGDVTFPNATGCVVKVPAKLVCVRSSKGLTDPPPKNQVTGQFLLTSFACYKAKCPKNAAFTEGLEDQFGTRQLSLTTRKLLCAPGSVNFGLAG
jgi:hypothetical protein